MYREDNREQGVLRGRRLQEVEWCRCSKQKKEKGVVVHSRERKMQQSSMRKEIPKGTAKGEDTQRDIRRMLKMLREI